MKNNDLSLEALSFDTGEASNDRVISQATAIVRDSDGTRLLITFVVDPNEDREGMPHINMAETVHNDRQVINVVELDALTRGEIIYRNPVTTFYRFLPLIELESLRRRAKDLQEVLDKHRAATHGLPYDKFRQWRIDEAQRHLELTQRWIREMAGE